MATPNRNVEQHTHVPPVNNGPPFSNGLPSDGKRSLTAHRPPPQYGTGNGFYQQGYGHPPPWESGNGFSQADGNPSAYGPPPQYRSAYGSSQQGASSWSCDECKHQLNGTWYRPNYDLCDSCYKRRLPTNAEWLAYESSTASESQCDECKHIFGGVIFTVSYDICERCALVKPFYAPLNCGYRLTSSESCPDIVGAIVPRWWPAPHTPTPEYGSGFGISPQGHSFQQQQWQAPFAAQPQYQLPPFNQQAHGATRGFKPKKNHIKAGMRMLRTVADVAMNVALNGGAMFGTGFGNFGN